MPSVTSQQGASAALEIDGRSTGWLTSVEPALVEFTPDAAARGPGLLKLGEFAATQNLNGPSGLLDWVLSVMAKPSTPAANGSVVLADASFRARRRIDFTGGLVTEARFSDLDASAKQPFSMGVKWQPAGVAFSKASGAVAVPPQGKRKAWLSSNFRVQGLPFDARLVTKLQLPVVTPQLAPGTGRKQAGYAGVGLGDVTIGVSASSADNVLDYVSKLMQDGALTDDEYFDFSVELLDAALAKTLATLSFGRCGLLRLAQPTEGTAETARKTFTLSFSVERFDLKFA